jgi:hypothetical protein
LAAINPTKPKSASLAYPLVFLAQLPKGCEESKIMMNKDMMEDKLDGSSNFKFLEDKNSKGRLIVGDTKRCHYDIPPS